MIQNNIKSIREQFQKNGVFHTPPETIAKFSEKLFSYLPKEQIHEVCDPTCGVGGLYTIFGDEVKKYGQELDENFLHYCRENTPNFEWYAGDTLEQDFFEGRKFQCVIANPPFSVKWKPENHLEDPKFAKIFDKKWRAILPPKSKADYTFMLHIIDKMADNGVALVVLFPGVLYRGNSEGKLRTWLLEQNIIEEIFEIPSGSFVDTSIQTVGFILNKAKTSNTIKITANREKADGTVEMKTETITLDDIRKEEYNLGLSKYVHNEEKPLEKPDIDEIYDLTFNTFKRSIEMHALGVQIFGECPKKFLDLLERCKKFLNTYL